jgi:hypothetical protein
MKAVFGAFKPTWAAKAIASISLIIAILDFCCANRLSQNQPSARNHFAHKGCGKSFHVARGPDVHHGHRNSYPVIL